MNNDKIRVKPNDRINKKMQMTFSANNNIRNEVNKLQSPLVKSIGITNNSDQPV